MKALALALIALAFATVPAQASGWNDYELKIAPGFSIYRANDLDVCLGTSDGSLIVCPSSSRDLSVGPLNAYMVTEEWILTRHRGLRRASENPTEFEGASEEFFFIVSRATRAVEGPFDRASFASRSPVPSQSLKWIAPHNPNFWLPLFGGLLFLSYTVWFFGWPVIVVLFAALGWWFVQRRLRRQPAA